MTRAEQKVQSIQKEIEKLEKSLNRYKGILEKKIAKCEKLECKWTREQMIEKRENGEMSQDQWAAWFDMSCSESNVEDTQHRLENAFKRLERANAEFEKVAEHLAEDEAIVAKELEWLEASQKNEEEYYKWLAQFKRECLEDGIIIKEASAAFISGYTKGGKGFVMYINNGWTERSNHSYTLTVNGTVYFTSGLFSTGYRYLKNN